MMENDKRIIEMEKILAEKKKGLIEQRFSPITSCIISNNGVEYNINTLSINDLALLYLRLSSLLKESLPKSIADMNSSDIIMSGHKLSDWLKDIDGKVAELQYREKVKGINMLEIKLKELMSADLKKKVELDDMSLFLDEL